MDYLGTLKGTNGDSFNKLAEDAQDSLKAFEAEIRKDERLRVISLLKEKGVDKSILLIIE